MRVDYIENLTTELEAWEKSRHTKAIYPLVVQRYLANTREEDIFTRQGVNQYLLKLEKEKKSQNTKRLEYYVLKRFFEVNNQPWPFPKGAPKKPKEVNAPKMESEDIKKLIRASKVCLEDWEIGIVALSTTYGLRREEIHLVREDSIRKGKIFIKTVKGGVDTEHLLPEVVAPYIISWAELPQRHRPAITTLSLLYHSILSRCGVSDTERGGYHSIRRRLATDLREAGLDLGIVYQFLRWQLPSVMGILGVYSKLEQEKVDNLVFKVHPYLWLW